MNKAETNGIGFAVKTIRKSIGMSERDLAEKAGYKSQNAIVSIENNSMVPSWDKYKDIANALGVSIGQIKGYKKIQISKNGYPILSKAESEALMIFAPLLEKLPEDKKNLLVDMAIAYLSVNKEIPDWEKPNYAKEKK